MNTFYARFEIGSNGGGAYSSKNTKETVVSAKPKAVEPVGKKNRVELNIDFEQAAKELAAWKAA